MERAKTVEVLSRDAEVLRERFGVVELSLFGSVARDEARADSDVDVVVSFSATPSLMAFVELKAFLEQALGTRVDLGTRQGLRPRVRPFVERGVVRVA